MNHHRHCSERRSGTVLIIVVGVCGLLASLTLAFLVRMRSDVIETDLVLAHAQAKIMLIAACTYVQEASRLGYDRFGAAGSAGNLHDEAFGWVDVRDGRIGPLGVDGQPALGWSQDNRVDHGAGRRLPRWPAIGGVVRCPMYRLEVPPYAIALTASYNPMQTSDRSLTDTFCWPLLTRPDPQPYLTNGYRHQVRPNSASSGVEASSYAAFATGRPQAVMTTQGRAWFRVLRDGPSTFLVTCGAGGSDGFRDWDEVAAAGPEAVMRFGNDRALFESLRIGELRLWYRLEWSAATMDQTYNLLQNDVAKTHLHYLARPLNVSHDYLGSPRSQSQHRNPVGTIRWVQRLRQEPAWW